MQLDTVFFDRLVKTMDTNHNIIRANRDPLKITEAWISFGDQLLNQCKEILYTAKSSEEHDAVFNHINEIMEAEFDEDMFKMSLKKTMDKLDKFEEEIIGDVDENRLEQD